MWKIHTDILKHILANVLAMRAPDDKIAMIEILSSSFRFNDNKTCTTNRPKLYEEIQGLYVPQAQASMPRQRSHK